MTFQTLFDRLLEVERAAATGDFGVILGLTIEAEGMVLQLERELIDVLSGGPGKAA